MNIYIIIPAHNEEDVIALMLDSLIQQTFLAEKVVVVNDNSTDKTQEIVENYAQKHSWLSLINASSTDEHIPGAKVIEAFYRGLDTLDNNYDVICKFDADIILPNNYFERLTELFKSDVYIGIAGGLAYIKKGNTWVYEAVANKTHVRGPFKAYRKACFKDIGGLKPSIGWDTVDTLLAQYHDWKIITDETLKVKHLKPTGSTYNKNSKQLQGEALYKMRYGFLLTLITALKMAMRKKSIVVFKNYASGYLKAKNSNIDFIVNKDEGEFIRKLRWKGVFKALKL